MKKFSKSIFTAATVYDHQSMWPSHSSCPPSLRYLFAGFHLCLLRARSLQLLGSLAVYTELSVSETRPNKEKIVNNQQMFLSEHICASSLNIRCSFTPAVRLLLLTGQTQTLILEHVYYSKLAEKHPRKYTQHNPGILGLQFTFYAFLLNRS